MAFSPISPDAPVTRTGMTPTVAPYRSTKMVEKKLARDVSAPCGQGSLEPTGGSPDLRTPPRNDDRPLGEPSPPGGGSSVSEASGHGEGFPALRGRSRARTRLLGVGTILWRW